MKITKWVCGFLLAGGLVFVGCKQKEPPLPAQIVTMQQMQQAFANASPELQSSANKVASGIRYGQYANALAELDKMVNDPSLTPDQKKTADAMLEQVKAIMATNAPPAQ